MSLSRLPPEVLLYVLGYLGSGFFSHDIRRLTVSRAWYSLASTVLARDLHLTTKSLEAFAASKAALDRSRAYITTVELFLEVNETCSQVSLSNEPEPASRHISDALPTPMQLESSLAKLAAFLPQCPGLRSLSIQAKSQEALRLDDQPHLSATPLARLLSLQHLTTLDFDTAGYPIASSLERRTHFCSCINSLLPSLRRLRCRMEEICQDILKCPPSDSALEEVIINLSISQLSDEVTSYRYPHRCQTVARDFLELKLLMHTQAVALAAALPNPRIIRVISHDLPSCDITAFDAITGRQFKLKDNINWDADCESSSEMSEHNGSDESNESDENDLFDGDSPIAPQVVW